MFLLAALSWGLIFLPSCFYTGGVQYLPKVMERESRLVQASYEVATQPAGLIEDGEVCAVAYNVAVQFDWRPIWLFAYDFPERGLPAMGRVFAQCPIGMAEEIFDHLPLLLEAAKPRHHSPQRYLSFVPLPRVGQVFLISLPGQNSFEDRFTSWDDCGLLPPAEDVDCLGDKGFLETEVNVAPKGAPPMMIHLVNVHFESGDDPIDIAVRHNQVRQLVTALTAVQDKPVIIGGDFNMYWSRPADRRVLKELEHAGFEDACELMQCDEDGLDRFFVRSTRSARIEVKSIQSLKPVTDEQGNQTSDHAPLKVVFRWKVLKSNGEVLAQHP